MVEFNNSQRLGLDLDRHIALDAGAGTGKTTVMAERYVQHLMAEEQRATHVTPPGPRTPLSGHGALRAPKRERTDQRAWLGLLPAEVVAITFTRKAAAELKSRIRERLSLSRDRPLKPGEEGIFDPRLRNSGDIEMLMSSLDEAPISTIDAFLNQLVQPYIDLVALYPSNQHVAEERQPLMVQDTLNTVWRIRSPEDAAEAGVLHHQSAFVEARDRLVARLGGQYAADIVLGGLLDRSMFVEQSHRSMIQRASDLGLAWNGRGPVPLEVLLDTIAEPVVDHLPEFVAQVHTGLSQWVNTFLPYSAHLVIPAQPGHHLTRFNHLVRLLDQSLPQTPGDQLVWAWKAFIGLTTYSNLSKDDCTFFPKNHLPSTNGWPAGLLTKTDAKKEMDNQTAIDIYEQAAALTPGLNALLTTPQAGLIRLLARSVFLLNPGDGFDGMPLDCELRMDPLESPLPLLPSDRTMYVTGSLQTEILSDLIVLHAGCHQILARRKSLDGLHDFEDMQRFAADLLLARCPDICRHRYPPDVIDTLDALGDEPWSDTHIARAMTMLHDHPDLHDDLQRRFALLSDLRRQYRAFIIDEYQDTNPTQYRLLARLWGRRRKQADDPERPLGAWDPTVCLVGDMKQSIYRFRQAEVSVMRRSVAAVRHFNAVEATDPRLDHLRLPGHGRDPRPVGAGGEAGSFSNEHDDEGSAPHSFVAFDRNDDGEAGSVTGERLLRRHEGHIDLTSNHRTRHNLMETMNDIFDDVFDPAHHRLPGDWHAEAQRLNPARDTTEPGVLEWLLPLQGTLGDTPLDLDEPVNTFEDPSAKPYELEHELLADRLHALLSGQSTRIWDSAASAWVELPPADPPVRPDDIMILVNSRTHLTDLVERLRSRGLPVMADRQGLLLSQPVVQPLVSVLALMANPTMRKAGVELARSPVIGMSDTQVHEAFTQLTPGSPVWPCLIHHAPSEGVRQLLLDIQHLMEWGAVYDVFDAVLDRSDLLVAYPEDAQRQFAEAWLVMAHTMGQTCGHDVAAMYRRTVELRNLGRDGPQAITQPDASAVQIMTIHGSKGLQAPVVVVTGLFSAGRADASTAVRDNILVTPQVVAGRIQPWLASKRPEDGLWAFAADMNKAQDRAELRRKFYVALTRVRDRLILTGAPGSEGSFDSDTGVVSARFAPTSSTMGRMLVEGMRRASWCAGSVNAPWMLPGDNDHDVLPPFVPPKDKVEFNPATLVDQSPLGVLGVEGVHLYHHPGCFSHPSPLSAQQRARELSQRLLQGAGPEPMVASPLVVDEQIKGAAHHLDGTFACPRKYWLESVKGWPSEPFQLPLTSTQQSTEDFWPKATTFGLMMHRVLEIGLTNPLAKSESTPALDRAWLHRNDDQLATSSTIARVMSEFGHDLSSDAGAVIADRLTHLAELIDQGLLGQMVRGLAVDGWTVEAVRTELPFFHQEQIVLETDNGGPVMLTHRRTAAQLRTVSMDFSGRADLVLALVHESGQGALQVVDLKTRGCLASFNPADPSQGDALQEAPPTCFSTAPQNSSETELLAEHRLQLTLYSLALQAQEAKKPAEQQRVVLPPALLVGANGRMIQLTADEVKAAQKDLEDHLAWRAALHLNPGLEAPPRLASGNSTCWSCAYYRGDLRRCAPEGESLGLVVKPGDER